MIDLLRDYVRVHEPVNTQLPLTKFVKGGRLEWWEHMQRWGLQGAIHNLPRITMRTKRWGYARGIWWICVEMTLQQTHKIQDAILENDLNNLRSIHTVIPDHLCRRKIRIYTCVIVAECSLIPPFDFLKEFWDRSMRWWSISLQDPKFFNIQDQSIGPWFSYEFLRGFGYGAYVGAASA